MTHSDGAARGLAFFGLVAIVGQLTILQNEPVRSRWSAGPVQMSYGRSDKPSVFVPTSKIRPFLQAVASRVSFKWDQAKRREDALSPARWWGIAAVVDHSCVIISAARLGRRGLRSERPVLGRHGLPEPSLHLVIFDQIHGRLAARVSDQHISASRMGKLEHVNVFALRCFVHERRAVALRRRGARSKVNTRSPGGFEHSDQAIRLASRDIGGKMFQVVRIQGAVAALDEPGHLRRGGTVQTGATAVVDDGIICRGLRQKEAHELSAAQRAGDVEGRLACSILGVDVAVAVI